MHRPRFPSMRFAAMFAVTLGATSSLASSAYAAPTDNEQMIAEALFAQGKRAMAAGNTEDACTKFEASHRVSPKLGTLLNLAVCHQKLGKSASAWREFREANKIAEESGQRERAAFADEQANQIEPQLARVIFTTSNTNGLKLTLGTVEIPSSAVGVDVPVDPGSYTLHIDRPGQPEQTMPVIIPPGPSKTTVVLPKIESPAPPVANTAPLIAPPEPAPVNDAPASHTTSTRAFVGYTAAVAGGIAIVGSLAAGGIAISKKNQGNSLCPNFKCTGDGYDDIKSAHSTANLATGLMIGGVVAAAGGITLLVLDHSSKTNTQVGAAVSPGYAGLALTGGF